MRGRKAKQEEEMYIRFNPIRNKKGEETVGYSGAIDIIIPSHKENKKHKEKKGWRAKTAEQKPD